VQRLVEVVDRRRRVPIGPQRVQQDVAVQPLITRERQQLDQRPRFAEPPHPGFHGLTITLDNEPAEQPDLHDPPPDRA
jgi:hypothetical protein